jgi:hypothetical protein
MYKAPPPAVSSEEFYETGPARAEAHRAAPCPFYRLYGLVSVFASLRYPLDGTLSGL